ncbi:hypothetical protein CVM73_02335 [Bradyrhizobium forestalis]|uniref:Uncharacterized protein n=1 Tax=Bradyrhizobium forestalis TaxID=1419263 RepID=A0A2M8RF30_9BRAD|nr:hypothetical protein CVM73_02335 [Bradyrhizobium forestalis]
MAMPNTATTIRTNRSVRSLCRGAPCGFPQAGQTEGPIGISFSQNSRIIGASMTHLAVRASVAPNSCAARLPAR